MASSVRKQAGFTLVELMITVVILIILASVGYPMYVDKVQKARRSGAKSALTELAAVQERYFAMNGRYGTAGQLGSGFTDIQTSAPNYALAVSATTTSFSITATARAKQASDSGCTSFTLDQLGAMTATGSDAAKCW